MQRIFMLQNWVTISGGAGAAVTQAEDGYLDLENFRDIVVYPEFSFITGSSTLTIQTSPITDSAMFSTMATFAPSGFGQQTPVTTQFASASVPLARWIRWRLTNASAWSATFRIWVRVTGARWSETTPIEDDDMARGAPAGLELPRPGRSSFEARTQIARDRNSR